MAIPIMPEESLYANAINAALKGDGGYIEQDVSALVPVQDSVWQDGTVQTVNARDLHVFLGVGRDFSNWIKGRIEQYGFVENQDFVVVSPVLADQKGQGGDRRSIDYHITLDMAKELSMVERNAKGKEARQYFIACEKRLKNTIAMPNFADPVAAARAWADEYEAKLKAEALNRALAQQIETDRPYTEIARAITGSGTMVVRDWIALMKDDHGIKLKEKRVREFLHDSGYWYWTQTHPRETRAYSQFSHLFKLEPELVNGIYRNVLKITGQGVLELTPVVIKHFS